MLFRKMIIALGMSIFLFAITDKESLRCLAAEEIIYGEMKDGFFVRTFYEDVQSIPYERGTPEYENELEKIKEARYLDELTPQMKEAGYVLINGVAYPGNETNGEAGEKQNTVSEGDATGYLSISTEIDGEVNQNCYVDLAKTDDGYKIYSIKLYPANKFSASTELPIGHYEVSGGGLEGDVTSAYVAEGEEFDIKEGSATVLCLRISSNTISEKADEVVQQQKNEEKEKLNIEIQENEKKNTKTNIAALVISILFVIVSVTIAVFVWMKKREVWN